MYLRGVIDRIDQLPGGALIIDYKSGSAAGHSKTSVADFRDVQLPLYALAWDQENPRNPTAAISYIFLGAADAAGMQSLIPLNEPLVNRKEGIKLSWEQYKQLLIRHCFAIEDRIREWRFPAQPGNTQYCRRCPLLGLCPRQIIIEEEESYDEAE